MVTASVAGPADRESFFAAQGRYRRHARWYGAMTLASVVLAGIPLSAVLTPVLLAVGFAGVFVVSAVSTFVAGPVDGTVPLDGDGTGTSTAVRGMAAALFVASAILPGAIAQVLLFLRVRGLLRRSGADVLLSEVGAREPRTSDPAESRLVNVTVEMAIAAGLPPMRVRIVDVTLGDAGDGRDAPNAAILGPSPERATLVATRSLLERADRETIQAVVAYLVGAAGNGDLRVATGTVAARMTTVAVQMLLAAPFSAPSRALLWPGRGRHSAAVRRLLLGLRTEPEDRTGSGGFFRQLVAAPFLIVGPCYSVCSEALWATFIRPWQRRFLQARSAHADAVAVQLTRQADPLARAVTLVTAGSPGGYVAYPMELAVFVGSEAGRRDTWLAARPAAPARLWRLSRLGARVQGAAPPRPLASTMLRAALATPFRLIWYALVLGFVSAFTIFTIYVTVFMLFMIIGAVFGVLITIPILVYLIWTSLGR